MPIAPPRCGHAFMRTSCRPRSTRAHRTSVRHRARRSAPCRGCHRGTPCVRRAPRCPGRRRRPPGSIRRHPLRSARCRRRARPSIDDPGQVDPGVGPSRAAVEPCQRIGHIKRPLSELVVLLPRVSGLSRPAPRYSADNGRVKGIPRGGSLSGADRPGRQDGSRPHRRRSRSRQDCVEIAIAVLFPHWTGVVCGNVGMAHRRLTWADMSFFLSSPSSSAC
jgi:hypothetical protein